MYYSTRYSHQLTYIMHYFTRYAHFLSCILLFSLFSIVIFLISAAFKSLTHTEFEVFIRVHTLCSYQYPKMQRFLQDANHFQM